MIDNDMITSFSAFFIENKFIFFFILGGVLLIGELLGTAGYLLWSGIAAIITSIVATIMPSLSWYWLWSIFVILTFVVLFFWWKRTKERNKKEKNSLIRTDYNMNLIGKRAILSLPLQSGTGQIKLGDSFWRVQGTEELPAGEEVTIINVENNFLIVKSSKSLENT